MQYSLMRMGAACGGASLAFLAGIGLGENLPETVSRHDGELNELRGKVSSLESSVATLQEDSRVPGRVGPAGPTGPEGPPGRDMGSYPLLAGARQLKTGNLPTGDYYPTANGSNGEDEGPGFLIAMLTPNGGQIGVYEGQVKSGSDWVTVSRIWLNEDRTIRHGTLFVPVPDGGKWRLTSPDSDNNPFKQLADVSLTWVPLLGSSDSP